MAQALPIHIVNEIERRWQRQLDARPQTKLSKNDDRGAGACPHCGAPVSIEPAIPGDADAGRDHVCSSCGRAWRNKAQ